MKSNNNTITRCLSQINWFGLAAGILTLIVILVSLYYPWWQLVIGKDTVKINVSPMNTNFGLLGTHFTIPLIYALNIGSILTFLCSGIIMLIYSISPNKPYAKELLDFSWKKPLYSVITSTLCLTLIILTAQAIFKMNIPLIGTALINLPTEFTEGVNISVLATANFQWPLYLALTTAILCIIAKIYHKKLYNNKQQKHK
jgi:hypothetical protein